jgi:SH3-like domain-containing protein
MVRGGRMLLAVWLAALALLPGCKRVVKPAEMAYVAASQANLRDRVAAVYNKAGTVHNGEAVEVLEKSRRFVKVKSVRGEVGWIEQRYLVDASVFEGFQKLAAANAGLTVQAHATTRASLNMHLTPGRETEHLFQLKEGEKLEILKRATAEKAQPRSIPTAVKQKPPGKKEDTPPAPPLEDWSLVRDGHGRSGWVLSRMVDLDVPLEIAQYSEGQRIAAYFVLNQVQDEDKKVAQYLILLTDNKDGQPWDFNQARIFTWNLKRHRYETAYRERKLFGLFPARAGSEDFGKEGVLPVFVLRVQDDGGKVVDKKYKLNGPMVRRVLSPEEQQAKAERPARAVSRKRRR